MPSPQPLTLPQIEALVAHGIPDSTLSIQVQKHGLAFEISPAVLDELRAKGTGTLTISAIEATRTEHNAAHPSGSDAIPQERDWSRFSPIPLAPGTTLDELRSIEIFAAGQYGVGSQIEYERSAATFSAAESSRLDYGPYITDEGTLELWIKVDHGYRYDNYQFRGNQDEAVVFSSDCSGGDVTWPGTTKLIVKANGDITLFMATNKYNKPPVEPTVARATGFRFGEWHAIGISYGNAGQWIMLDGKIVAGSHFLTQKLGRAGDHSEPLDEPTIGETPCHFWHPHQYEGGFEGVLAGVRLSKQQKDWALATVIPQSLSPSNNSTGHGSRAESVEVPADVAAANLVQKIEPFYPPIARAARVSGMVVLRLVVSKVGSVQDIRVVSGPALLQQSAIEAVKKWRYRPYLLNGQPVEILTSVNVIFTADR